MMDDAIDGALDDDEMEGETEDLVNQVRVSKSEKRGEERLTRYE
jgi:hypothetical protein